MTILEFASHYPDEHSCRMDLKEKRESEGMKCKSCGSTHLNWLSTRYSWHCNSCQFRTSIRSGTIMQDSKLSVRTWYACMALMSCTKKTISAHEAQRQLGLKNYRPAWEMMHKIRVAMGQRDDRYGLEGMLELDEGHFSVAYKKSAKLKRGKGSQKKQNVLVMAESTPLEDPNTGEQSSQCRYFKMKVLDGQSSNEIMTEVKESVVSESLVISDKSKLYHDLDKIVETHVSEYSSKETTNGSLKWVHIAITNAKNLFKGVFHKINREFLQNYLNEFCYKLNRRYFRLGVFQRLTFTMASSLCKQTT